MLIQCRTDLLISHSRILLLLLLIVHLESSIRESGRDSNSAIEARENFRFIRFESAGDATYQAVPDCMLAPLGVQLLGNLTGIVFETVEGHLSVLADLDEVAVGITHVAAPFPAVIVERLGKEGRSFVAPLFVAGPDVCDTQVKEAIHSVEIGRASCRERG